MTITVKTKRELNKQVKELRSKGYNIVTYGDTLMELEKGNSFIVIKR